MLDAPYTQFTFMPDGQICYQKTLNNPLPGDVVGHVVKGDTLSTPKAQATQSEQSDKLQSILDEHLKTVLAPLFFLKAPHEGDIKPVCHEIADHVYQSMGTVPRGEIDHLTAALDADDRRVLRYWKIRLGPILVFQPDLNKPAAVKLRAMLWSLYNDKALPAAAPPDGVVSVRLDTADKDTAFYRAIGYPLYGPRAVRIDMLDRVINAVYDLAEGGTFQAQHQMAEWLGCPIDDLYQILEAMGHTKIYDPLDEKKDEKRDEKIGEQQASEPMSGPMSESVSNNASTNNAPKSAEDTQTQLLDIKTAEGRPVGEDKSPQTDVGVTKINAQESVTDHAKSEDDKTRDSAPENTKPELATFRLKKGKAFASGHTRRTKKPSAHSKGKPQKQRRGKKAYKPKKNMEFGAKPNNPADSPFAVLQQLKDGA